MASGEGLRSIKPLSADSLRGISPAAVGKNLPKFEWVDPKTLYVEERYQRGVSERGVRLVRQIYSGFDWTHFKPPVCVRLPEFGSVLVCIDGQHTALAAASHPTIDKIPVMVVHAADVAARAGAFVGHNRDRVALTPPMIYHAELAAGDASAIAIDRACRAAGAHVLPTSVNLKLQQPVGATIAIGTMRQVAKRHGEELLVRVLKVLVAAKRGPIKADEIAAGALVLLVGAEDGKLAEVIASRTSEQWAAIGAVKAADSGEALASAVASCWCRQLGVSSKQVKANAAKSRAPRVVAAAAAPTPPKPAPPQPAAATSPPQQPEDPARYVRRNGVTIDLRDRTLHHRGSKLALRDDDGIRLVAALARVMPAILDPDRLAMKTFQRRLSDPADHLGQLIAKLNPQLRAARLEIRTVPKIGNTLFDMGTA